MHEIPPIHLRAKQVYTWRNNQFNDLSEVYEYFITNKQNIAEGEFVESKIIYEIVKTDEFKNRGKK